MIIMTITRGLKFNKKEEWDWGAQEATMILFPSLLNCQNMKKEKRWIQDKIKTYLEAYTIWLYKDKHSFWS